jgi:hypothetical protein
MQAIVEFSNDDWRLIAELELTTADSLVIAE